MGEIVSVSSSASSYIFGRSILTTRLMIPSGSGCGRRSATLNCSTIAAIGPTTIVGSERSGSRIESKERSKESRHFAYISRILCRQERRRRHVLDAHARYHSTLHCIQHRHVFGLSHWLNSISFVQQAVSRRSCRKRCVQNDVGESQTGDRYQKDPIGIDSFRAEFVTRWHALQQCSDSSMLVH